MKKQACKVVKIIDKIWDAVITLFLVGILVIQFVPVLFGYMPVTCLSNSMAPVFYQGSLCYIDIKYDVDSVKKGDIIAFQLPDGSYVTHRVYGMTEDGMIITKGDANEDVDISPISREQIMGKNVLQLEYLGNLFYGFPNMLMIRIVVFMLVFKFFLWYACKVFSEEDKEHEKIKKNADNCSDNG